MSVMIINILRILKFSNAKWIDCPWCRATVSDNTFVYLRLKSFCLFRNASPQEKKRKEKEKGVNSALMKKLLLKKVIEFSNFYATFSRYFPKQEIQKSNKNI